MKSILLVNGPPSSGKDATGKIIKDMLGDQVYVTKFAHALKIATAALYHALNGDPSFGMMDDHGYLVHEGPMYDDAHYEDVKEEPNDLFFGRSWREALIAVSETLCKPPHGDDFFGKLLLKRIQARPEQLIVITDSGFLGEAQPLIDAMPPDSVNVLRLIRPGCSFVGDSRGYIHPLGAGNHPLENNGDLKDLEDNLANHVLPKIGWMR